MTDSIEPAVWFPAIRTCSGVDIFTQTLCEGLRDAGVFAEITWLPHRAEYAPWTVRRPKPPDWANIVHVNTWLPKRFLPNLLPVVATMHLCVHDSELAIYKTRAQKFYHHHWIRPMEASVFRCAVRSVAVSHYTARRTRETFQAPTLDVVHNGVDTHNTFTCSPRRHPHSPFRLLYAGNWSRRKGVDLLPQIMTRLGEDYRLDITAERHDWDLSMPPTSECRFLGRLRSKRDMFNAYNNADALVFPSRMEGLPLVVIEAMSCGLPVVATDGYSMPEVVEDQITGFLCPLNNVEAFVAAVRQLATDKSCYRQQSRAARERAVSVFSQERLISSYLAVYQNCLITGAG